MVNGCIKQMLHTSIFVFYICMYNTYTLVHNMYMIDQLLFRIHVLNITRIKQMSTFYWCIPIHFAG